MKTLHRRCFRPLAAQLFALLLGLFCTIPAAVADDLDVYTNPATSSLKPPYTVLVLDLNLLGLCPAGQTASDGSQLCLSLTTDMLLGDLLTSLGADASDLVSDLLSSTYQCTTETDSSTCTLNATILCDVYDALGLTSLTLPIPGLDWLLQELLGTITTLSCATLTTLLEIVNSVPILGPTLGALLNTIMSSFVGSLISGLIDPPLPDEEGLLSTLVGQLPPTIDNLLKTTLSGLIFTFLANVGIPSLISLLESILNTLINTNVAIMVSHADRSSLAGTPPGNLSSLPAANCAFADAASIPGPRRTTVPSPGCSNGAYVLIGFTTLVDQGSVRSLLTTVTNLLLGLLNPSELLNNLSAILATTVTTPTQLLPPFQAKEVYAELSHYLAGDEVYNAPLKTYDGIIGLLSPAANQMDSSGKTVPMQNASGNYIAPGLECDTANVINVMLTQSTRERESNTTLNQYFPALPIDSDPFSKIKGSVDPFTLDDVVRQAKSPGFDSKVRPGHKITLNSYFLLESVLGSTSALANVGATVLTYLDALGLLNLGQSLSELLKPTLSVDASLHTPSLTIDLANPANVRSEVFLPLFKPPEDKTPRWSGNVKKLALSANGDGSYAYRDARGDEALDDQGRIDDDALTYWTQTGAALGGASVDGGSTTLGGAGQQIPGYVHGGGGAPGRRNQDSNARQLFYDSRDTNNNKLTLKALDADSPTAPAVVELVSAVGAVAETQAACGADKTAEQVTQELLLHARGYDTGGSCEQSKGSASVSGRSWLHGAVLHSRPVAINYGGSTPDIRVVYGASDGYLRMVRNSDGAETWGFMPQAVMGQQKVLRDNQATPDLPYGVDGAPAVLLQDRGATDALGVVAPADGRIESSNANDRAWIFFGLRRSGRHYYGIDATDPAKPKLLWRLGPDGLYKPSGKQDGSADYAELGLTFSTPQIGRMRLPGDDGKTQTRSVLVFGGGYHGGWSNGVRVGKDAARGSAGQVGSDDALGNAVFIVDAENGKLIWKAVKGSYGYTASTKAFAHPWLADSIPSDVTVVDSDGDGLLDRLYVADSGGRLWRGDFPGSDRSRWTLAPIADLGRHVTADVANDRRFFHAPDYVPYRSGNAAYDAIVLASGDREDPFNYTTENYLYAFRDTDIVTGKSANQIPGSGAAGAPAMAQPDGFADLTSACAGGAADCSSRYTQKLRTGWKIRLATSGEKALSQPLTVGGSVFFTSYVPVAATCEADEGHSKFYGVALADSRPVVQSYIDDGDGDARSGKGQRPGLPGEFSPISAMTVGANTESLVPAARRYYETYWRERRNDEESPP